MKMNRWAWIWLILLFGGNWIVLADDLGSLELQSVKTGRRDGGSVVLQRGRIDVPMVRSRSETGSVSLEFHQFSKENKSNTAPPIFLLNGGPGFVGLSRDLRRRGYYDAAIARYTAISDVVVVGQRGIGSSTPHTGCKPMKRDPVDQIVDQETRAGTLTEACQACKEHWESRKLELAGLNVVEAAADVITVADALGYDKICLVGGSFGSHWGMTILRNHPDRVSRALFSGLEGPDHTYDMPSYVLNALKRIAVAAEEAPGLQDHIPPGGLIDGFANRVKELEQEPKLIALGTQQVMLDATQLRKFAVGYSAVPNSREGIRTWPLDMIRIANGEYEPAAKAIAMKYLNNNMPTAAFYMMDCSSGISDDRLQQLKNDPAIAIVGDLGWSYQTACQVWQADLGETFRQPFLTQVPTLLVHGTWDLLTPLENALELEDSFANGKLVIVEGGSHNAFNEALRFGGFRDAVNDFLATGNLSEVPKQVKLPELDWHVPL